MLNTFFTINLLYICWIDYKQCPGLYRDAAGSTGEPVADAQWISAAQRGVVQRIFQALFGDTCGSAGTGKDGNDSPGASRKRNASIVYCGNHRIPVKQVPTSATACKTGQALDIGNGVIQAASGSTINAEAAETAVPAFTQSCHHVSVILFLRQYNGFGAAGRRSGQGIEIPDHQVRHNSMFPQIGKAPVRCNDKISGLEIGQLIMLSCSKQEAGMFLAFPHKEYPSSNKKRCFPEGSTFQTKILSEMLPAPVLTDRFQGSGSTFSTRMRTVSALSPPASRTV